MNRPTLIPAQSVEPTSTSPAGSTPTHSSDRAWPIVAVRELTVKLTDRNFLIGTAFTLVLLVGALVFQGFMAGRDSTSTVAVTNSQASALVAQAAATNARMGSSTTVKTVTVGDDAAARAAVNDGSADAYLHGQPGAWVLTTKDSPSDSLARVVGEAVRSDALARNAAAANTTVVALEKGSVLATDQLTPSSDQSGFLVRFLAGFIFAMLFYMASLLFGMAIAQSVVEEKQSRVVEILATAIPVRQLLIGKVVGNTVLALLQMTLFVGAGLFGVTFTEYKKMLPSLTGSVLWYLVFFLAGFITLACVWAVAGALASRVEDLQSTTTPLTMLLVVVLFGGLSASGSAAVITSYVPLISTITMPLRLLTGEAAWWEPLVSLAITLVAAGLIILVAEKLYRRSLLQTQGRVSIRQALRAAD